MGSLFPCQGLRWINSLVLLAPQSIAASKFSFKAVGESAEEDGHSRTSLCMVEEEEEEIAALCSPDPAEPRHLTQVWSSTGLNGAPCAAAFHSVTLLSLRDKLARC